MLKFKLGDSDSYEHFTSEQSNFIYVKDDIKIYKSWEVDRIVGKEDD